MSRSFADLGVSSCVVDALARRGVTAPFAVQKLAVPDVLAGRDLLVQSPTGSGKTLAFGVPLVDRIEADAKRPAALILAPTRELATQISEDLQEIAHARALSVAAVYGGVGIAKQAKAAARAHILVATPGRLEDLLERRELTLANVRVLVLDEADRMLDMGFKPAVDRIVKQVPRERQTLFFSATLEGAVGGIAKSYTRDARRHVHAPVPEKASEVKHRFVHLEHAAKLGALLGELGAESRGRTLVFVRTKRGADRLVKRLAGHRVDAIAMHGNKSQAQREKALARFHRGDVDTLVATDVAARGIDVADITHVINFDAPDDRDSYVHRTGRTGRAGAGGIAASFVLAEQAREMGQIARELGLDREFAKAGEPARGASSPPGALRQGARQNGGGRGNGGRANGAGGQGKRQKPRGHKPGQKSRGAKSSSSKVYSAGSRDRRW